MFAVRLSARLTLTAVQRYRTEEETKGLLCVAGVLDQKVPSRMQKRRCRMPTAFLDALASVFSFWNLGLSSDSSLACIGGSRRVHIVLSYRVGETDENPVDKDKHASERQPKRTTRALPSTIPL